MIIKFHSRVDAVLAAQLRGHHLPNGGMVEYLTTYRSKLLASVAYENSEVIGWAGFVMWLEEGQLSVWVDSSHRERRIATKLVNDMMSHVGKLIVKPRRPNYPIEVDVFDDVTYKLYIPVLNKLGFPAKLRT